MTPELNSGHKLYKRLRRTLGNNQCNQRINNSNKITSGLQMTNNMKYKWPSKKVKWIYGKRKKLSKIENSDRDRNRQI